MKDRMIEAAERHLDAPTIGSAHVERALIAALQAVECEWPVLHGGGGHSCARDAADYLLLAVLEGHK